MVSRPAYPVAGHVLLTRGPDGKQLASFFPAGTDTPHALADEDNPLWRAWFDVMDAPRREREAWRSSPHNPNGSFEEHDPEDAPRDACEDYERTNDG